MAAATTLRETSRRLRTAAGDVAARLPPLLVQVGTAEILYSDATRLAARAGDDNLRLTLSVWPDMVHVWHFFSFLLKEGKDALREAGDYLKSQLS